MLYLAKQKSVERKGGVQQQALWEECGSLKPQLSNVGQQNQDLYEKLCEGPSVRRFLGCEINYKWKKPDKKEILMNLNGNSLFSSYFYL